MSWIVYSLLNAFFESISNVFGKKSIEQVNIYLVAWAHRFFSLFILTPLVFLSNAFEPVSLLFWFALGISSVLNTIAFLLFFQALKESPLSLALPIVTLTPLFLLITSPLIVGEFPSVISLVGIIITVIGSYILNLSKRSVSFMEPLLSITKIKGTRYMLIVAFMWSITANFDKIAVQQSNPILYTFTFMVVNLLMISLILLIKRISLQPVITHAKLLAPVGLTVGISVYFQMLAISLTLVPNVIAVKRTSALFGVFWGKIIFKEQNMAERFFGTLIMVLGVILIVIGSA